MESASKYWLKTFLDFVCLVDFSEARRLDAPMCCTSGHPPARNAVPARAVVLDIVRLLAGCVPNVDDFHTLP